MFVISLLLFFQSSFLDQQKKYPRVREALMEKQSNIESSLKSVGLNTSNFNMLLVAYKNEDVLELYVKEKNVKAYKKLTSFEVCQRSGVLGPKRKQGDFQVPEGFYYIDRFNPVSNYHLSLGLNYPNSADKIKGVKGNLGGDIFIHGSCVTVGCLPMTNDLIKEIYLYAVLAKNNGQKQIPVYVFPFRMTDETLKNYSKESPELRTFWENLKLGYDKFSRDKQELKFTLNETGDYVF